MFWALSRYFAFIFGPVRVLILTLGVVLLGQALSMRTVQASCGDWLDHSSLAGGEESRSVRELADDGAPREPAPFPCDGPGCRQAPDPAAPPAPYQFEITPKEHVCRLSSFAASGTSWTLRVWDREAATPQPGHPESLLRPPCVLTSS